MIANFIKQILLTGALVCFTANVFAIDASNVPKNKQSATGLYFTSVEASEYMAKTDICHRLRPPLVDGEKNGKIKKSCI